MKRSLMIFMMLAIILNIASSELTVYKTIGIIKKKESKSWNILEKHSVINDMDVIQIGKNSSLSLLDKNENRVYICDIEGEWTIANIIKKCKKENQNITNRIIAETRKQIVKRQQKSYTSIGGVKRDAHDEEVIEYIYSQLCKYLNSPNMVQSTFTEFKKIYSDDNTFHFEITNKGDYPIYTNILYHPNQTDIWRVLYECSSDYPCLEITADSTIKMEHERMIDDNGCYILFSTNVLFDSSELNYMFKEKMEPEEIGQKSLLINIAVLSE